jgi:uncharacterized protein (TIGR03118 family)
MNLVSLETGRWIRTRFGFENPSARLRRPAKADRRCRGSLFEILEDRTLLAVLPTDNVLNLKGLAIAAAQNVQTTQDVATFADTDTSAIPADFTATITWPGGGTNTGVITEDASNVFHVTGTHTFNTAGLGQAIGVTIKDSNGTLYGTGAFNQTNLVSSVSGTAGLTDPNLINPWGMSSSASSPIWVSDQGSAHSTLYNPNGTPVIQALVVTIPSPGAPSGPTGLLFNSDTSTTDFTIPGPSSTVVPSIFLFANLNGTIAGWNPGSTAGSGAAITAATTPGAAFTGLAQASVTVGPTTTYYLYAADFTGTTGASGIDVFNPSFTNVSGTTFAGKFSDPNSVAGYHPFNIQFLNGDMYVAYAQPSASVTTGGGYIDEFDTAGNFINRIYTDTAGTNLKGPWGMTIAPAGFGSFAGDLLVGNLGDGTTTAPNGTIIAITVPTAPGSPGTLAGTLSTPNGTITNGATWSLLFGNGGAGGTTGTLYFSAGTDAQAEGLFGSIAFAAGASASVTAAPLTAQGATVTGIEGNPLATAPADVLVATFMDTGTPGSPASYSATIDWGDKTGTTAPTRITSQGVANGTVFSIFGNHTYAETGTHAITVTITNTADGAQAIASGQAVIADAALTPSVTQPSVAQTEGVVFSGPVASFTDGNPSATTSDYTYVTINWGDGTPATAGTITQTGTIMVPAFLVSGTHTYADAGVNGGIGHYAITVNVHDKDGATATIDNTAAVADVPLTLTGKLNPASDSGISSADSITNVVQPNFLGTTSEPNANVTLFAAPAGGTPVVIGQGVSNANDAWSITANAALATGTYVITAVAVDSAGFTTSATTTIVADLVVDTVAPVITAATFDRFTDTLTVTYEDNLSGLALASITNGAFYHLSARPLSPKVPVPKMLLPTAISFTPGVTATDPVVVSVVFNRGHTVRGGRYLIIINSGAGDTGVQDVAGNALDGNFYGKFPSGDGLPGGNFAASIDTFHNNIVLPPVPFQDGYVPPGAAVDPPAHSKTAKPSQKLVHSTVKAKVNLATPPLKQPRAHDLAIEALTLDTKDKRLHA